MNNTKKNLKQAASSLIGASADLVFIPSPPQRQTKAKFMVSLEENPSVDPSEVSLAAAIQITGDSRLEKWWKRPGFADWFRGKEEFKERLEYLCQLGLDTAEDILLSDDPKSVNAKVSLIKVLLESGGKMPAKGKEVKFLDEAVQKMNKQQLEQQLKRLKLIQGEDDDKKEEASG